MREKNILNPDGSLKKDKCEPDMTEMVFDDRFKTRIIVVRHGQSIGNERHEFLGHTDKDLSALGYRQAERTAEYLAYADITRVYASDLKRAHNTAVPHANMRELQVIDSKELREIYAGAWEGMNVEDIIKQYPTEFLDGWREKFGEFTIPGGESVMELGKRINAEMEKIAEANIGKTVLVAFHAAAIRAFWGIITGTDQKDLASSIQFPTNASVSVVYYDNGKLIPGEYSHDAHLRDLI